MVSSSNKNSRFSKPKGSQAKRSASTDEQKAPRYPRSSSLISSSKRSERSRTEDARAASMPSFAERTRLRKTPRTIDMTPEQREQVERRQSASSSRSQSRSSNRTQAAPVRSRRSAEDRLREHAFREIENKEQRAHQARRSQEMHLKRESRAAARNKDNNTLGDVRRERRNRESQIRRYKSIAVALGVLALIIFAIIGINALVNSSFFNANKIEVHNNALLSSEEVVELASVDTSSSLILLDKKALISKVEANPLIEKVSISRKLPNTVSIEVTEHEPYVRVKLSETETWLLSKDGYWLGIVAPDMLSTSYRLSGEATQTHLLDTTNLIELGDIPDPDPKVGEKAQSPEAENALAIILGVSKELRADIKTISAVSAAKTKIYTKDGIEIGFGNAKDIVEKDRIARSIMKEEKGRVVLINVRAVDKPTWRGLNK